MFKEQPSSKSKEALDPKERALEGLAKATDSFIDFKLAEGKGELEDLNEHERAALEAVNQIRLQLYLEEARKRGASGEEIFKAAFPEKESMLKKLIFWKREKKE